MRAKVSAASPEASAFISWPGAPLLPCVGVSLSCLHLLFQAEKPESCTVLIKGPNKHTLGQLKDAVRDGLRAVKCTLDDMCVVPGAGAFEVAALCNLEDYLEKAQGYASCWSLMPESSSCGSATLGRCSFASFLTDPSVEDWCFDARRSGFTGLGSGPWAVGRDVLDGQGPRRRPCITLHYNRLHLPKIINCFSCTGTRVADGLFAPCSL